jgi:hypothetical protein
LKPVVSLLVACDRLLRRPLRPARSVSRLAIGGAPDLTRTRSELLAENALLRQQVVVLRRQMDRPRLHQDDRLLLVILARLTERWRDALHLVCPDTLLRWHRDLFKIVWRRRSRPKRPANRLAREVVEIIQAMAANNVLWGAERIRGELLKLGIRVSKRTIQKYMRAVRPPLGDAVRPGARSSETTASRSGPATFCSITTCCSDPSSHSSSSFMARGKSFTAT